ncbi:MAG: TGS domain-containing protein [Desulfurococcales archaeon]|jgi:ribosome-interacting GTPase 1|nr:TGS domain-containing protein [Desulfurococcales archaeon]
MVTNLPPEARAKFAKYQEARTPEEKLQALQEFLSAVPKHKGTENLVQWARRRMAELREEIEERKSRKGGGRGSIYTIERTGAAQIVMIGFTKAGKTAILARLTNARVAPSDIPYATKIPTPGMLDYQDIQFQLVEAPSIIRGDRGSRWNRRSIGLLRNADGVIIVVDLSLDPVSAYREIVEMLEEENIKVTRPRGIVVIEKSQAAHGIRIIYSGKLLNGTGEDVKKILEGYRIYRATVRIYGEVTLEDVENSILGTTIYRPAIVIGNKADLDNGVRCRELREAVDREIPVLCGSALKGTDLESLGEVIFNRLELIRVYTKPPNAEPSKKPLVTRRGSTVLDIAKEIHKDLYRGFKYARIWGPSANYPGERVGGDHILEDGDIVEIHSTT